MTKLLRGIALLLFAGFGAFGQDRGSVTGTVTDPSGAVVPDARITAKNAATGLTQTATTGANGTYSLLYLTVGTYTVTAEKQSFRKAEANDVRVDVNTTARMDIQLTVGAVDQTVEVTAAAPLLSTEGSNLGKVLPAKAILDLPLAINGGLRSTMAFVILTPGVIGSAGNPRIGGGLLDGQSEYLDGAESQSQRRNDPAMNGVSVEAIQEFKVQSSSYSAEYGRMSNGVINWATKSGTNQLHGTGFEFFRNEIFDARGFTYGPGTRGARRQNNPGFSAGGPIYIPKVYDGRNKLFFFTAFEYATFRGPQPTNLVTIPTDAMRNGDFRGYTNSAGQMIPLYDPFDANGNIIADATARPRLQCNGVLNVICPGRLDPTAMKLQSILPEPGNPNQTFNNTQAVSNPISRSNVFSIKGDYVINEKNRVSFFFSRYYNPAIQALGPTPGVPSSDSWGTSNNIKYYRVNEDYVIRPNLLNHLTVGFDQRHILENPDNTAQIPDDFRQAVQIPGTTIGGSPGHMTRYDTEFVNYGSHVNTDSRQRTESVYEQLAWIKGKHNLKFGFQYYNGHYRRLDCNTCAGRISYSASATGNPAISGQTGANYAAFLLGAASGGSFNYSADIDFFFPYYAWFVQDDFKVSRKFTLNIGLRYEVPIPKTEARFQNSNFCPSCPNPAAGGLPGAMIFAGYGPGRSGIEHFGDTRLNAWGPRLGFAYQLDEKTVIRAGAAIFYQPTREDGNADNGIQGFGGSYGVPSNNFSTGVSFLVRNGFNTFASAVQANKPPVIDPTIQLYGTPFYYNPSAGRAPYFGDWDFTVERTLAKDSVFRASYHATVGVKMLSRKQTQDQLDPKYLALYGTLLTLPISDPRVQALHLALPYPSYPTTRQLQQMLRPYPQYNGIDSNAGGQNDGHMTWHALETSFEHRYNNGIWFLFSYTYSKLISLSDGEDANRGDGSGQNQYNRALDKSVGLQDQSHVFNLSYVYELPFGRGKRYLSNMSKVTNALFGNWRISGVQRYTSGFPIQILSNQNMFGAAGTTRASFAPGAGTAIPLINPAWNPADPNSQYINQAAFVRPPNGVYGNTPRWISQLRGPWSLSEDISVLKNFNITEAKYFELRASAFNIGNRHVLGGAGGTGPGIDLNMDDAAFGKITNPQTNSPRSIQFALKFVF
jgi:hypothetical protein